MVSTRGDSPYGPLDEQRGGHIRYPTEGGVQALRENAYRKMYDHCDGRYRILLEWDEVEGAVTKVWINSNRSQLIAFDGPLSPSRYGPPEGDAQVTSGASGAYRNIEFQCEDEAVAQSPAAPATLSGELPAEDPAGGALETAPTPVAQDVP